MTAATKRGKRRSDSARGAKSRGKCDASARESKRMQVGQAARSCSCAIANDAAAEAIVRRPRMDPAEAFREHGVDEHKVAETYAHMINTLSASIKKGAVQKLLLDALKEVMRVLESKRANERAGDRGGAQVVVQLVHQVARPERGMESPAAARMRGVELFQPTEEATWQPVAPHSDI